MYNLNNKVAIVTGAAYEVGLGHAIAIRLAQEGADVAVVDVINVPKIGGKDRNNGWQGLDSVVKEIEALGRRGLAVITDISSSKEVGIMVEKVMNYFGKIDVLVNNSAFMGESTLVVDFSEELWNKTLSINLSGTFFCCKEIATIMIKQGNGGKIINFSSNIGKVPWPERAAYAASKAGVISLTQTLALELGRYKINVNAICPGQFKTGLIDNYLSGKALREGVSIQEVKDQLFSSSMPKIPLQRFGQLEEIASSVAFLASNEADYITGQALSIDGGALMGR